ncbi:MAG: hypothetical protein UNLARM2_0393 [Candidatus Micrarchaeum acidiphilum ARMAN-2]|uniref:Yip1 domain-containing protein n=1 Tax=Candidatus Micrarchaeum acidiphilum ARMAN-2 TaxID=425595 RepID=C7DH47_MICA2|nr:MAG: hypothetical protein UNLARM2_0393 [Candidatus Micrarchaeum acidiphilum ARMAN-2]
MSFVDFFVESYRKAFGIMLHPGKNARGALSVGDALKFYYTIAIIPLILGVALSLLTNASFLSVFGGFSGSSALGPGAAAPGGGLYFALYLIAFFAVLVPLGLLFDTAMYHVIIKSLLKMYNKPYSTAFTAFTYAMIPAVLVYWLLPLGILGYLVILLFGLWSLVIEIISLSNLLSISRLMALGSLILDELIVAVILFGALFLAILGSAGPMLLNSSVISSNHSVPTTIPNYINTTSIAVPATTIPSTNTSQSGPYSSIVGTQPASTSSANYSSCANFTISNPNEYNQTSHASTLVYATCKWGGGMLYVYTAGGNSGYAHLNINGSNGKTYFANSTNSRCYAYAGSFYAPAQDYKLWISAGGGGGICGNAAALIVSANHVNTSAAAPGSSIKLPFGSMLFSSSSTPSNVSSAANRILGSTQLDFYSNDSARVLLQNGTEIWLGTIPLNESHLQNLSF